MTTRSAVLLLLAFAAGGAIGYVVGTAGEPEGIEPPTPAASPSGGAGAPRPAGPPPPAPGDWFDLGSVPVPEVETGDGTITGTVLTEDGSPVPGAVVRARPWAGTDPEPPELDGAPAPPDLREFVREAVGSWHENRLSGRETTTGPDGAFVLEGIGAGSWFVQAWATGLLVEQEDGYRFRAGQEIRFVARRVVEVPVRVVCEGMDPPEEMHLHCERGEYRQYERWSPRLRSIWLAPGEWTITARLEDREEVVSEPVVAKVSVDVVSTPVTIRLIARPGICGKVKGVQGLGDGFVTVRALRLAPGTEPDPQQLARSRQLDLIQPRHESSFVFRNLEPGRWMIGVSLGMRSVLHWEVVEVGDGMLTHDLEVPPPGEEGSLTVVVLGPDGKPREDVSFVIGHRGDDLLSGDPSFAARLDDGSWRVSLPEFPSSLDAAAGALIEARCGALGSGWATFTPGEDERLTIRLRESAHVTVNLKGYVDSGYAGCVEIRLVPVFGGQAARTGVDPRPDWAGEFEAAGRRRFGPISAGTYEVAAVAELQRFDDWWVARRTVTLEPGENSAELVLPPLGSLTVTVDGIPDGGDVELRAGTEGNGASMDAEVKDGKARFERVPHGPYVVQASAGGRSARTQVRVSGSSSAHLEVRVPNALRIVITDPEGVAAKAGLKDGDLAIAADGKEFEDPEQMSKALVEAAADDRLELTVLRGSRTFTVEFDRKEVTKAGGDWGMRWEPATR